MKSFKIQKRLFKEFKNNSISLPTAIDDHDTLVSYTGHSEKIDELVAEFKALKKKSSVNILFYKKIKCAVVIINSELYVPYNTIMGATHKANLINQDLLFGAIIVKKSGHIVYQCRVYFSSKRINKIIYGQLIKSIQHAFAKKNLNNFTDLIIKEKTLGNSLY